MRGPTSQAKTGGITGAALGEVWGIAGLDARDRSFTDASVSILLTGVIFEIGGYAIIELTGSQGGEPNPVPEPATLSLLGLGLAGPDGSSAAGPRPPPLPLA